MQLVIFAPTVGKINQKKQDKKMRKQLDVKPYVIKHFLTLLLDGGKRCESN